MESCHFYQCWLYVKPRSSKYQIQSNSSWHPLGDLFPQENKLSLTPGKKQLFPTWHSTEILQSNCKWGYESQQLLSSSFPCPPQSWILLLLFPSSFFLLVLIYYDLRNNKLRAMLWKLCVLPTYYPEWKSSEIFRILYKVSPHLILSQRMNES